MKIGKHTFRRIRENGKKGNMIAIPENLRAKADEAAIKANGKEFLFELPDTTRKAKGRHYRVNEGVV